VGNIRVSLRGGPEDGREIHVPADSSGVPVPRITLPARLPRNAQALPPLLIYERHDAPTSGQWEFRYVGAETQNQD
jgi:hypothetical protein